jgi:ribosomal protein L7/L12
MGYLVVGVMFMAVLFGLARIRAGANASAGKSFPTPGYPVSMPTGGSLPPLSPRVQEIARNPDQKIAAIKAYREETGLGLKEAKDAVEAWQASGAAGHLQDASSPQPQPAWRAPGALPPLSENVKRIARDPSGRIEKIMAIKAYREETGAGLAEAKNAVEAWLATGEPAQPIAASPVAASPMPREPEPADAASSTAAQPALSKRVQDSARDPTRRAAASRAYQEETGADAERAKNAIESWLRSQGLG